MRSQVVHSLRTIHAPAARSAGADGVARGVAFGLLLVAPFWALVALLLLR